MLNCCRSEHVLGAYLFDHDFVMEGLEVVRQDHIATGFARNR